MSQREYRKPRNFNKEESGAHERDNFNQIGDDRAVNVSVSCHNDTRIEVTGYLNQKSPVTSIRSHRLPLSEEKTDIMYYQVYIALETCIQCRAKMATSIT